MINYFIDLFTKPQYKWSFLDNLAFCGLIIAVLIIIFAIWFVIWFILDLRKEHKYKTCERICYGQPCWHHQDCLRCPEYKKKEKEDVKD